MNKIAEYLSPGLFLGTLLALQRMRQISPEAFRALIAKSRNPAVSLTGRHICQILLHGDHVVMHDDASEIVHRIQGSFGRNSLSQEELDLLSEQCLGMHDVTLRVVQHVERSCSGGLRGVLDEIEMTEQQI